MLSRLKFLNIIKLEEYLEFMKVIESNSLFIDAFFSHHLLSREEFRYIQLLLFQVLG